MRRCLLKGCEQRFRPAENLEARGIGAWSFAAKVGEETVTHAQTQEGSIVGTMQYMATEQLQEHVYGAERK